jgi:hypothetical protein
LIDYGSIVEASLIIAGFLIGIYALVPKEVQEQFIGYGSLLIPPHALFIITSIFAVLENPLALLFILSAIIEIVLFSIMVVWLVLIVRYYKPLES